MQIRLVMATVATVTSWTAWSNWTSLEARDTTWLVQLPYLVKKQQQTNIKNVALNCNCTCEHYQSEECKSVESILFKHKCYCQHGPKLLYPLLSLTDVTSKDNRRIDPLAFVFTLFIVCLWGFFAVHLKLHQYQCNKHSPQSSVMVFFVFFREWLLPAAESQWTLHSLHPSAQKTPHCKLTSEAAPISQQEPETLDFIAALHLPNDWSCQETCYLLFKSK